MGYRFLDDYDPRKEQKKKQQQKGTQKAPPSGNPLNPAAQNNNSAEADKVRHPDADTDTAGADIEAAQHSGLRCGGLQ